MKSVTDGRPEGQMMGAALLRACLTLKWDNTGGSSAPQLRKTGIKWRHEGFDFRKTRWSLGIAISGRRASRLDSGLTGGGSVFRRYGKALHFRTGQAHRFDPGKANLNESNGRSHYQQEERGGRQPKKVRQSDKEGLKHSKGRADCPHSSGFCRFRGITPHGAATGHAAYPRSLRGRNQICAAAYR